MHTVKVLDLPLTKLRDKGTPIDNVSNYDSSTERCLYLCDMESIRSKRLIFATQLSMLKVVEGSEFDVTRRTMGATKLLDHDMLLFVGEQKENQTLVMQSAADYFLRIDAATIPEKKKGAVGVRGMRLQKNDTLAGVTLLAEGEEAEVTVKGKPVSLQRLHVANRDTKGVKR